MNRDQRRHPGKDVKPTDAPPQKVLQGGRSQDAPDPRTTNSGHGKKTADKWNQ